MYNLFDNYSNFAKEEGKERKKRGLGFYAGAGGGTVAGLGLLGAGIRYGGAEIEGRRTKGGKGTLSSSPYTSLKSGSAGGSLRQLSSDWGEVKKAMGSAGQKISKAPWGKIGAYGAAGAGAIAAGTGVYNYLKGRKRRKAEADAMAEEAALGRVGRAKRRARELYGTAKARAGEAYGTAKARAGEAYGTAKARAGEAYGTARGRASEVYGKARTKASDLYNRVRNRNAE